MTRRKQFRWSLMLGRCGHFRDLPFLLGRLKHLVFVISCREIVYLIQKRPILALLPCRFCLVFNTLDEIRYIFIASMKYIFPDKLCCVCCGPSVATTSTNKGLAKTFRI